MSRFLAREISSLKSDFLVYFYGFFSKKKHYGIFGDLNKKSAVTSYEIKMKVFKKLRELRSWALYGGVNKSPLAKTQGTGAYKFWQFDCP